MGDLVHRDKWEMSYQNRNNFVFYPNEEIIRFYAKHLRKKCGVDDYIDLVENVTNFKGLDFGCGIGRHVIFSIQMGIECVGIDLSESAISIAKEWARKENLSDLDKRFIVGDGQKLPYEENSFDFAVSHGVLDSMGLNIAIKSCRELSRVLKSGAMFYCDLISGDDIEHKYDYCGEETVVSEHEKGTVQSYFNDEKIKKMIDGRFLINECYLVKKTDSLTGKYHSRYHLHLENK